MVRVGRECALLEHGQLANPVGAQLVPANPDCAAACVHGVGDDDGLVIPEVAIRQPVAKNAGTRS
jgi:hypothetical protein